MAGFVVKARRITVEKVLYTYSVSEGVEGLELLVYRDKRPFVRLGQSWTEAWGINLCRPGVVARVIRYYRQKGPPPAPRQLCQEPALFDELACLCFTAEEQEEKQRFLQTCGRTRARQEVRILAEGE